MDITQSSSTALTTAYASAELADIRADAQTQYLRAQLDSLSVTTGGKVTCFLCTDASGDEGITLEAEADIAYGNTTATDGWAVFSIDKKLGHSRLYVRGKLNSGTGNCVWHLVQG